MNQNISGFVASGYNYIINPAFEINQRGVASVSTNGFRPVDMWTVPGSGSTFVASQQSFTIGQSSVPDNPKNYVRVDVTSVAGNSNCTVIVNKIENVKTLSGKIATLSFWAQTTTSAKPISYELNQIFGSGGSAQVSTVAGGKVTLSTSWTKYIFTFNIPSIAGKTMGALDYLELAFWLDAGSDWNSRTNSLGQQSGRFEFANVKLEAGTVATPFRVPAYDEELRKCQRYLQVFGGNVTYEALSVLYPATSATTCPTMIVLKNAMRTTPSLIAPTSYTNFGLSDGNALTALSVNPSITSSNSSFNTVILSCTVASGLTVTRPYVLYTNNQTTDRIILSAEL